MAVGYIRPAGGLSTADRALLVPENIRGGVSIFGVTGTVIPFVPQSAVIGVIAAAWASGGTVMGSPYFAQTNSSTLTCTMPCSVKITASGKGQGGGGDGYLQVRVRGGIVINKVNSSGYWGTNTWTGQLNAGNTVALGLAGDLGNAGAYLTITLT